MFVLLAGPGALQTIAQLPCFGPGTGLGRTYSISIFYDISMVYLLRVMLMIRIAHVPCFLIRCGSVAFIAPGQARLVGKAHQWLQGRHF